MYRRFQEGFFGLGGELRKGGGATWEDISIEDRLMGGENFNEGGAEFSSII